MAKKPVAPVEHPPMIEGTWCGKPHYTSPYGDFEHTERSKVIDHMNANHPLPVIEDDEPAPVVAPVGEPEPDDAPVDADDLSGEDDE